MRVTNKGKACSVRECSTSARCRGFCNRHYKRYRKYGDPTHEPAPRTSKRCSHCKTEKPLDQFYERETGRCRSWCIPCFSAGLRQRSLVQKYGITIEQFDELLAAQGGGCAICGRSSYSDERDQNLAVDHDHETGVVRGILCGYCNRFLGLAGDSPERLERAAAYLRGLS